ncbi:haloacid dehalogenase-like hydrolase [Amycolatopsis sp. cg5]|uniref:haloacid dehalogenase-like hydrolase n=1 Tax=Amycolatopsis sp. cg5 TaxID=3238802 RepID=UPI00352641D9
MATNLHDLVEKLPKTLVLWDVDHTLIENGGVSKDTYALAFELLTGRSIEIRPVTDGRTDFQIMRDILEANSVDASGYVEIAQFEGVLTKAMERNAPELPKRGHILPGVLDALAALKSAPNVVQSALTGNILPNARAKLAAFDLDSRVDMEVGGYGSDDKVRSNLVDASRRKVAEKYGITFDRSSTILIGDTLEDVKAGHDGDAKVIAVATGIYSVDQLSKAGADVTLADLSNLSLFLTSLAKLRNDQS